MMGSQAPSQSTLSDLTVLLELLQAASDPAKAKKVIADISAARKQYDDAIAESVAKLRELDDASRKAEASAAKAESSADKLDKKQAALDARTGELDAASAALATERKEFEVYKAESLAASNVANTKADNRMADAVAKMDELDKKMKALDAKSEKLDAKMAEMESAKAEYEDKLAKLKALTA